MAAANLAVAFAIIALFTNGMDRWTLKAPKTIEKHTFCVFVCVCVVLCVKSVIFVTFFSVFFPK